MEKKIETYDETACKCTWYADCLYCMAWADGDYEANCIICRIKAARGASE